MEGFWAALPATNHSTISALFSLQKQMRPEGIGLRLISNGLPVNSGGEHPNQAFRSGRSSMDARAASLQV